MKTLRFSGWSDDVFGEYNVSKTEIDNAASGKPIYCHLTSSEGEMYVIGQYSRLKNGCWDIGICQIEEDVPLPNWPIRFSAADGWSVVLEIDVPDDCELNFIKVE